MNDIVVQNNQELAPTKSVAHEMVSLISSMAMNKDLDPDKFEKMMNVQIRMMDKQSEIEFNQDYIMMQNELPIIAQKGSIKAKDKDTGIYRETSKYSRFEDIMEAINPILQKYGFSFRHTSKSSDGGRIEVISILMHRGGHSESTSFISPMDKENALKSGMQAAKSTLSFGKRTNVISCLNLQEASENSDYFQSQTISIEQAEEIDNMIKATDTDREKLYAFCGGINSTLEITLQNYSKVKQMLQAKAGKAL